MDASILKYQAFVETARLGSLTRAAEQMGYSQSGVSRMIADLERDWEVTLFNRGRRGITLTPDGERILPVAQRLCSEYHLLEERVGEVRGLETGAVRIGTVSSVATYILPRVLGDLQRRHPHIDYELLLGDYDQIERWVDSGRVDVGFLPYEPAAGIDRAAIDRDELVAVVPRGHELAAKESVTLRELARGPFLMLEQESAGMVPRLFRRARLSPSVWLRTWDDYAIMALVEAGLGVSVLPSLILSRCPFDVAILPLEPRAYRDIYVTHRPQGELSRATRDFLRHLGESLENAGERSER